MLRFLRKGNKRTKIVWWVLIIITVVTFVFLFGAGFDGTSRGPKTGSLGSVNGEAITRSDLDLAIAEQRDNFRRQYGSEPAERDAKLVETQAWRGLVAQRLMAAQAKLLGIKASDREVVLTLQTQPPAQVTSNSAFLTDGKFDAAKYQAALRDPNNNWAGFEDMIRAQLPVRKLQERLLSSIKLSEPELRQAYRDRFEAVSGVALQLVPDGSEPAPAPTAGALDSVYQKYKSRFYAGPRVELELLTVPKTYTEEDTRSARQIAQTIVDRAKRGEDFAALARDYSEGPAADKGGVLDRVFQPGDLGPDLGTHVLELKPGDVTQPYVENGRVLVIKVLERVPQSGQPMPGFRLAQIVIKVHANENALRDQYADLTKLRARAAQLKSLGKAAIEKKLATTKTGFFDTNTNPPSLLGVPEAMDWGLNAKAGAISPIFEGVDEFAIAEVSSKHEGGPLSRDELSDQLRQIAELEARVEKLKPRADLVKAALDRGQSLEQAAQSVGVPTFSFTRITRAQADPRLAQSPEVLGAIFGATPGRTIGPIRTVNGWHFARVDQKFAPTPALYDSVKGQLSTEILTRRQRGFFAGWLGDLQSKAKIQDQRGGNGGR